MGDRHLNFLRWAVTAAATAWMCPAGAQTLAAIAPVTLSPNPNSPNAVSATTGEAIAVPEDPIKAAAFNVLDTHCARCHQAGKLVGRSKPAKGFGNILDLDAVAANGKYVRPGDADRSLVYHVIVRREMPSDVFQDGDLDHPVPEDRDLKALRAWITALDPNKVSGVQVASLAHAGEKIPAVSLSHDAVQPQHPAAAVAPAPVPAPAQAAAPAGVDRQIAPSGAAAQTELVALKEDDSTDADEARELIVSAQKNLRRLGCYKGELTGLVDAGLNAAIAHYNGIMGRGEQAAAVTSDMVEEMRSESGNICSTRPVLAIPTTPPVEPDFWELSRKPAATEKHEPHHPATSKTRVAHEPADRKPAAPHRAAKDFHFREPSFRQAQRAPSIHSAGRASGGGGGGGGGGGASTVSGINGI